MTLVIRISEKIALFCQPLPFVNGGFVLGGGCVSPVLDLKQKFIYVGIGGVGPTKNPHSRIVQHKNGGRSGDQFCVYIQDIFIIPDLLKKGHYKPEKQLLDHQIKTFIRQNLGYRFEIIEEIVRKDLIEIEEQIKRGVLGFLPLF